MQNAQTAPGLQRSFLLSPQGTPSRPFPSGPLLLPARKGGQPSPQHTHPPRVAEGLKRRPRPEESRARRARARPRGGFAHGRSVRRGAGRCRQGGAAEAPQRAAAGLCRQHVSGRRPANGCRRRPGRTARRAPPARAPARRTTKARPRPSARGWGERGGASLVPTLQRIYKAGERPLGLSFPGEPPHGRVR